MSHMNTATLESTTENTVVVPTRATVADLSKTPSTRNRAIDAYRGAAMCAVAFGHWIAADARVVDGAIKGGNALNNMRSLHILTWVFQVMPVFFCIGGFSNAASLDAHHRAGRANGSWIRARLGRLTAPSVWLAGTWLTVLTIGHLVGQGKLVTLAVGVAAIPLWFLANYVADTALSPITLRLYRKHGMKFVGVLIALFAVGEAARFPKWPYVPQMNIVLGWLLFQILGFAWKDGHLPSGRNLVAVGATSWSLAGLLVAFGPWPLAMVSVPGAQFANTWPPSLALMFYGVGLCSFAIAAAPFVSAFLTRNAKAWNVVVVANTMTMTSYLWHFTALSLATLILAKTTNLLPTAAIGTTAWWMQKMPLMAVSLIILLIIIAALSPKERKGLIGTANMAAVTASPMAESRAVARLTGVAAFALAAGFETWTAAEGDATFAGPGMIMVLGVHFGVKALNKAALNKAALHNASPNNETFTRAARRPAR
jgi:hypothetical protein